jgi:hypothetical protein
MGKNVHYFVAAVSLFVAFLAAQSFGSNSECALPPGLFQKRINLESKSSRGASDSQSDSTGEDSSTLAAIDERYFQFMEAVSKATSEKDLARLNNCCRSAANDAVARIVCSLAHYLAAGKSEAGSLLGEKQLSGQEMRALWALDEIAFRHATTSDDHLPNLFKPSGPTALYLDEIYRWAVVGNRAALARYVEIYPHADGEYAESMDDQWEQLFGKNTDVVLKNWDLIKLDPKVLQKLQEVVSAETRANIELRSKKDCTSYPIACKELLAFAKK